MFEGKYCHVEVDREKDRIELRCFGYSSETLQQFVNLCTDEATEKTLTVVHITGYMCTQSSGAVEIYTSESVVTRPKRPLSSIDMDPEIMEKLLKDLENYFHPLTREFYSAGGTPCRRGYLLYGPAGTGKT